MIDEWVALFKLYPNVFPKGYFKWLKVSLSISLANGTYIWNDGTLLTYKRYKRKGEFADAGDYMIEKLVCDKPGSGSASRVIDRFLFTIDGFTCYVKVRTDNTRAIRFYFKHGFTYASGPYEVVDGLLLLTRSS